jgi:hypothetical protein
MTVGAFEKSSNMAETVSGLMQDVFCINENWIQNLKQIVRASYKSKFVNRLFAYRKSTAKKCLEF